MRVCYRGELEREREYYRGELDGVVDGKAYLERGGGSCEGRGQGRRQEGRQGTDGDNRLVAKQSTQASLLLGNGHGAG